MTAKELNWVTEILEEDKKYSHFAKRLAKDFKENQTKGIPAAMSVFFIDHKGKRVGFAVISISPIKMREWEKTFKEEGWVEKSFVIDISSFELMYLYVQPEYRRKGKGTALFKNIIVYAKRNNIKKIYAYVNDTTNEGLQFYKKNNAEVIYDFSTDDEDGKTAAAFLMWKI